MSPTRGTSSAAELPFDSEHAVKESEISTALQSASATRPSPATTEPSFLIRPVMSMRRTIRGAGLE
jgi:hypothetical protein